jgi:nucleotide-binding universal stress UspA family protein
MPGFHHILFPVDFSDRCRTVRPFVKSIAQQFNAKLTLMHVVQVPTVWYGGIDGGYPIVCDVPAMEEAAKNELSAFFEPSDRVVAKIIKLGDPASEITQFAEQNQVDLIMMPTHGYGRFRNLLLGSVTAKVLHDVKCPVWTATHTEDPDLPKHLDCKNIMGTIDLTPENVVLIHRYVDLAREFNAKLRLVHAVPGGSSDIQSSVDQNFRRFLLQSAREEAARLQSKAGTNLEVCLEEGAVSEIVRAAALHHEADLVLIGRGTLQEKFGQLRTNAYAIIRDAPCPVLSV